MHKLAGLLVLMAVTSSAHAGLASGNDSSLLCQIEQWLGITSSCSDGGDGHRHHGPIPAPEIDPASAVSALTLLMGGLVVLRGRR
jgi:hypothetical protein